MDIGGERMERFVFTSVCVYVGQNISAKGENDCSSREEGSERENGMGYFCYYVLFCLLVCISASDV